MNITKKRTCILLTIALLLTLAPASAFAADVWLESGKPTTNPITVNSTVVGFAGQEWWVIGDGTSGVNPVNGHVTLLAKDNVYGNTMFRAGQVSDPGGWTEYPAVGGFYYEGSFNHPSDYNDSTLQRKMVALAGDTSFFPMKEAALITARTLTASDDTNYPITCGDVPNQKFWPLSYNEWQKINNATVFGFGNDFWLRSPYTESNAFYGDLNGSGVNVIRVAPSSFAARPAFNLNLASILFTSSAAGGKAKPTTARASLSAAEPTTDAVKFTFLDTSMALDVTATAAQFTQSGTTLTFGYRNAATGSKQWVSCVLKDGSDVKYYGKLADATMAANGTLAIPFAGVSPGTYTLEIFSEQDNGDNKSDFAGNSVTLTVAVSGGSATITDSGTLTQLSNNAGLASVATQTITAGSEAGTTTAPKTAGITVSNGKASVALADIVPTNANAAVTLYYDAFATMTPSVNLNVGANDVYIKVTAEDGTTELYYKVTVTRASAPSGNGGSGANGGSSSSSGTSYPAPNIINLTVAPIAGGAALTVVVFAGSASDGTPPSLSYQWYYWNEATKLWVVIPGATTPTFDYRGLIDGQEYTVRVRVGNHGNYTFSQSVTVTAGGTSPLASANQPLASQAAPFSAQGTVSAKSVNVRPGPNTKGKALGKLQWGDEVTVLGYENGFFMIEWEGGVGYVSADYLAVTFGTPLYAYIEGKVYAQTRMNTSSRYRAATYRKGDTATLLGRDGKWWIVEVDGERCYIRHGKYVQVQ